MPTKQTIVVNCATGEQVLESREVTQEELDQDALNLEADNYNIKLVQIDRLWRSATAWQEQFISNAAYGLLAIGVMQGKPKCLACMAWINSIWTDHYYVQKPLVDHNYTGYDFSVCGAMPYTVPEITAEVLG